MSRCLRRALAIGAPLLTPFLSSCSPAGRYTHLACPQPSLDAIVIHGHNSDEVLAEGQSLDENDPNGLGVHSASADAKLSESADPYVIVVAGLRMDESLAEGALLKGLGPRLSGVHSASIGVPRSHAREAYLRILRSPYREWGRLVEWTD